MESAKHIFRKFVFLTGVRITIAIFIVIIITVVITRTALKAYSESETKSYRQESIFNDVGSSKNNQHLADINPSPEPEKAPVIAMSFEVDKITPTPTPVFDPKEDAVWLLVADCESHQNWKDDTGNGYYGGLQFSLGAWASVGGSGKPSEASASEQIMRGKLLQQIRGWAAWGGCSKKLGLR